MTGRQKREDDLLACTEYGQVPMVLSGSNKYLAQPLSEKREPKPDSAKKDPMVAEVLLVLEINCTHQRQKGIDQEFEVGCQVVESGCSINV